MKSRVDFMLRWGAFFLLVIPAVVRVCVSFSPNPLFGFDPLQMPLIVLAVPLYDLVSVSVIRIRQGKSPLVGDQQHFSHRFVMRGLSGRSAVLMIWGCTLVTGIGGVMLSRLADWQAILVAVQTVVILFFIAAYERAALQSVGDGDGEDSS